jgi:sulfate transport system ATP-binding protein
MNVEVRHITKRFGSFTALDDVSLDVPSGELVALLGPSGCGKTTLLRILSGLEFADSGLIRFDKEDASRQTVGDRRVGFVFQHYALFRHMTVFENVAFGLRVRRVDRPSRVEIDHRVGELLALVKMEGLGGRYPAQLSGGQRQRIALARALAVQPRVLLLDEPFGALDARVRKDLRRWLRRLHDELHVTSVFVTHDVEEALEVADRVVVMNAGRIEQVGSPDEVYEKPASAFVYRFLGNVNVFHARTDQGQVAAIADGEAPDGTNLPLRAYARPHEIDLVRERGTDPAVEAVVARVQAIGPTVRVDLRSCASGALIEAELSRSRSRELNLQRGEHVFVRPDRASLFGPSAPEPPTGSDKPTLP